MKIYILILILFLTSCAHYNKDTKTFYGFGSYKDNDVEMKSTLFELPNIGLINE